MVRFALALLLLLSAAVALAEVADIYDFETVQQEQRFQELIAELRCPKCQNQNIADSNSPISKDMRDSVYRQMQAGAADEEIVDALVSRFGEFVRYKPEVDRRTILLWATPAIAVLGGLMIVVGVIVRSRRQADQPAALSVEEQARVDRMLAENDRDA